MGQRYWPAACPDTEAGVFTAEAVERLQHHRGTVARLARRGVLQLVLKAAIQQIPPAGRRGFQQLAVIDEGQIVVHQRRVTVVSAGDRAPPCGVKDASNCSFAARWINGGTVTSTSACGLVRSGQTLDDRAGAAYILHFDARRFGEGSELV